MIVGLRPSSLVLAHHRIVLCAHTLVVARELGVALEYAGVLGLQGRVRAVPTSTCIRKLAHETKIGG